MADKLPEDGKLSVAAESPLPVQKLGTLEAGRGLAAASVVLFHSSIAADAFTPGNYRAWFTWGALGVDFFFVLSGFIIYLVHHADPPGRKSAARFLKKRLKRIYIPYLPLGIGMAIVYSVLPKLSLGSYRWSWPTTITLLPLGYGPALLVAWTLVFEMIFYLVFLLFFFTRRFDLLMLAWAAAVIVVNVFGLFGPLPPPPWVQLFNYLILEFLAGMAMARIYISGAMPNRLMLLAISGILIATYILVPNAHRVVFGLGLAPLVLLVADWERRTKPRLPKAIVLIGAASYAIYLAQGPAISVTARLLSFMHNWTVNFLLLACSGVIAGLAYHLLFERPALRLASRGRVGTRLSRHGVV